ncbi:APC family permease [Mycoplasma iguanae]|uniref:APC family permease n=1 Tax=Mycoplasma iguanae TaxID=292461 RepID=A0ABY5RC38_9MOLU|nr:APC family permease [Mycoplasma iguanae]UVD81897.1 APC family permease [Mycoplasma iguanae]
MFLKFLKFGAKGSTDARFTEKQFFAFSLNFVVGFGFIATIGDIVSLGAWGMIVFAITAFAAMGTSLAFARVSERYPNELGGSYGYAKKAYKSKIAAFLQGWNVLSQVVVGSNNTPLFIGALLSYFDPARSNIYNLISLGVFIFIIFLVTLGLRLSKWLVFLSSSVKWLTIITGMVLVIILAAKDGNFVDNISNNKYISPAVIIGTSLTFMYAFGGFESLAGLSMDVKTKKIRILLVKVFATVFVLYFIAYLAFLFINVNRDVPLNFRGIFQISFGATGIVLFTIGIFFNRFSASVSNVLYYSKVFASLSIDGYLPKIFSKINAKGQYGNALWLISFSTSISSLLLYFLPRWIGIETGFDTFIQSTTISMFIQFILTIWTVLYLSTQSKIKIPFWEKVLYFLTIFLLTYILLIFVFPPALGDAINWSNLFAFLIWLGTMLLGFLISFFTTLLKKVQFFKQKQ